MFTLHYQGRIINVRESENVLDAFLRQGVEIPFSCRNGTCHTCLQRCVEGELPERSQQGLRAELIAQGYFKACCCVPLGDMKVVPPAAIFSPALLHSKEMLSPLVGRLLFEPPGNFGYRPGQFINLRRRDGVVRSYSLAGLPEDYFLEIHVQRREGGQMSNWLLDILQLGDEIEMCGPEGDCYYSQSMQGHPLLLVATGTGIAPVYAVVLDALKHGHASPIHVYHGGSEERQFYLREQWCVLARQHVNLHYHECLSGAGNVPLAMQAGRVHEVAFTQQTDLQGWHVFLAGHVMMVEGGEQLAAERGVVAANLHSEAFFLRNLRKAARQQNARSGKAGDDKYPPRDLELWNALRQGEMLREVLLDFYGRAFQDSRLASFFHGTTQRRAIEKQYLFMRQLMTGEKIYFGDRPKNAHHWMVISDELFDYRGNIMMECLRAQGLPEHMVQRFHRLEEFYRGDIVKSEPFARRMGGVEIPFEGLDKIVLDVGTLCDVCGCEISSGEMVRYHVRLGKIYCDTCGPQDNGH